MWLCGIHTCTAALENPRRTCHEIIVTEKLKPAFRRYKIPTQVVDNKTIEKIIQYDVPHQGVAVRVSPLPRMKIEECVKEKNSLIIILDQVTDPRNIGAILRAAAAFDVDCVITQTKHSAGETAILAKAASGGSDIVPLIEVTNIRATIDCLKAQNYWIYGLDCAGSNSLSEEIPNNRSALVLGAEGSGMRQLVRNSCDILVHIDINNIDSLNVSMAAGIALYQFRTFMKK